MLVNRSGLAGAILVLVTVSCLPMPHATSPGSSGSLTTGSGSMELFVDRTVLRPEFTELKLVKARVDVYYADRPPPRVAANRTQCDGPNRITVGTSPVSFTVPLQSTGAAFLGAFKTSVGSVVEIRLIMPSVAGTFRKQTVDIQSELKCAEGSDRQVVRLFLRDRLPFTINKGVTTTIATELNSLKDLRPMKNNEDGEHCRCNDQDADNSQSNGSKHDEKYRLPYSCHVEQFVLTSTLSAKTMSDQVNGRGIVNVFRDATSGSYVVRFADRMTPESVVATADEFRSRFGGTRGPVYTGAVPSTAYAGWTPEIAHAVARDHRVLFVDQDAVFHLDATQPLGASGPTSNPSLDRLDQRQNNRDFRFRHPHDGAGVRIYIVDSGISVNGTSFASRVDGGNSFTAIVGGNPLTDTDGHGTAMASVAAGTMGGTAKQATLVSVQISNGGLINLSNVNQGLQFLLTRPPGVVNLSIEAFTTSPMTMVDQLVTSLTAAGHIVVAAAGNSNEDTANIIPARAPQALTVGAMDVNTHQRWVSGTNQGSNFGAAIDLLAPGTAVQGETVTGSPVTLPAGTSQATAFASGVAAALLETEPGITPAVAIAKMKQAATPDVLSNLNGSANALLFSDIQASRLSTAVVNGGSVLCTFGISGGRWVPRNVAIMASTTDASNAVYIAYMESDPPLCRTLNPFETALQLIVTKRRASGAVLWSELVGTGFALGEQINRLIIGPGGDLFGVGTTLNTTNFTLDARVFRLKASDGSIMWNRNIDSGAYDTGSGIVALQSGQTIMVAGSTRGALSGANAGGVDAFVIRMNAGDGQFDATSAKGVLQFGSAGDDLIYDLANFEKDFVVAGSTTGNLFGPNLGGTDAFFANVIDAPSTMFRGTATQFGTAGSDLASAVIRATEMQAGAALPVVFAAGIVEGSLPGFTSSGGKDVFFARFDHPLLSPPTWIFQTGTAGEEAVPGLALSNDDLFVAAGTQWIKASRVSGLIAWSQPLQDQQSRVIADVSANVYLFGRGQGSGNALVERYQAF